MDLQQTLSLASVNFSRVLDGVATSTSPARRPCEAWSVGDLIWHVARGCDMSVLLLGGASKAEASQLFTVAAQGDVVGECRRAVGEQLSAFEADHDLELIVHHPTRDVPVRSSTISNHGRHPAIMGLGAGLGNDEVLADELVAHVARHARPLEGIIGQIGVFGQGPSGSLDPAASAQSRLLDLSGRLPRATRRPGAT